MLVPEKCRIDIYFMMERLKVKKAWVEYPHASIIKIPECYSPSTNAFSGKVALTKACTFGPITKIQGITTA